MKDAPPQSYRAHFPYLASLLLLVLLIGLPLLKGKLTAGHDSVYYLPRIVELAENLKAQTLVPRWAPDFSSGLGQPFFIFNPPLLYYLAAIFHLLGSRIIVAHNLALSTILLLAALGMYLLASSIYGPRGGLVAALAYVTAPYLLVNLYVRAAWSEFSAFAWIPFIFWGVYRFATEGSWRFLLVGSFVTALLVLSSNHISLITLPFALILVMWIAIFNRHWIVLWRGLLCLALGLGLSSFFLLPALVEKEYVHLEREVAGGGFNYQEHFLYPRQLLISAWDYGGSVPGPKDGMSFAIGPVQILMVVACIPLIGRVWKSSRLAGWWLAFMLIFLLGALFFTLPFSNPLWERLPTLQNLQFPWRFLSLAAVASAFIAGFLFVLVPADKKVLPNLLLVGLVAGLLLYSLPKAHPMYYHDSKDSDFTPENIVLGDVKATIFDMFEPKWVKKDPEPSVEAAVIKHADTGDAIESMRISPTHLHIIAALSAEKQLRANIHYFPGWKLFVDGVEQPIMFDNLYGLIDFTLGPGDHSIDLVFTETHIRRIGELLSLFTLVLLIGWCALSWLLKKQVFQPDISVDRF